MFKVLSGGKKDQMNISEKSNHNLSKFIPVRTKTEDFKRWTENVRNKRDPKGGIS